MEAGASEAGAMELPGASDINGTGAMEDIAGGHEAAGIADIAGSADGLWADTPAAATSVSNAAETRATGTRDFIT